MCGCLSFCSTCASRAALSAAASASLPAMTSRRTRFSTESCPLLRCFTSSASPKLPRPTVRTCSQREMESMIFILCDAIDIIFIYFYMYIYNVTFYFNYMVVLYCTDTDTT